MRRSGVEPVDLVEGMRPSRVDYVTDPPNYKSKEVLLVYAHATFAGSSATGAEDGGVSPPSPAGTQDFSRFGLGDVALTASYIPYLTRKGGVLTSVQIAAPTETSRVLGTGKWVIAPTIFLPGSVIFAPEYKQSNSFAGDGARADVNQGSTSTSSSNSIRAANGSSSTPPTC
jgi:hypothetical protein